MTVFGTVDCYSIISEARNRLGVVELVGYIFLIIFFGDRVMILLKFSFFANGKAKRFDT